MNSIFFTITGVCLIGLGFSAIFKDIHNLHRILALNIFGSGIFLLLVSLAYRGPDKIADPVPHALVLTGIVVAVASTALALTLMVRLTRSTSDINKEEQK